MINLEFNDKKYKLPTSFDEVNIETYSKIISLDKNLSDKERDIKIICLSTGIDEDIVRRIKMEQMMLIQEKLAFMFEIKKFELIERFKIDGVEYGFDYNLDLDKIPFSEYWDLKDYSKPEIVNDSIHIIMAILYRPIIKDKKFKIFNKNTEYKIIDYNSDEDILKRAELFKTKLTMDKALGGMVFFSIFYSAIFLNTMGNYGIKLKKKLMKQMKLLKVE
jgi:hypothetical protein